MRKSSATTMQAIDGDDREQFHAAAEIVLAAGGRLSRSSWNFGGGPDGPRSPQRRPSHSQNV
jgi:hypothetical protein